MGTTQSDDISVFMESEVTTFGCGPNIDLNAVINGSDPETSVASSAPEKMVKLSLKTASYRSTHGHESDESTDHDESEHNVEDDPLVSLLKWSQSLLTANDEYKQQICDLLTQNANLKSELHNVKNANQNLQEQCAAMTFKHQLDEQRLTILKKDIRQCQMEKDEAYGIIHQMENQYQTTLDEERLKYQNELDIAFEQERLMVEACPPPLPRKRSTSDSVMYELKQRDRELEASREALARKHQSLLNALELMDGMVSDTSLLIEETELHYTPTNEGNKSLKHKLKRFKSFRFPKSPKQRNKRRRHRRSETLPSLTNITQSIPKGFIEID